MNRIASGLAEQDSQESSQWQDGALQQAYGFLSDIRDNPQNLTTRLSAAGFDDIPKDGLLILSALGLDGVPARPLIRRLGISGQAASQSIASLVLRRYLEFRDNPEDPRQPVIAITDRGHAALHEAQTCHDADRWAKFPLRLGDIIISTVPKSGTTWVQMICALLIFQTPDLAAPLPKLSPWMETHAVGRSEIYAELANQQHRRFIKTHVPLNELPSDSRVIYIVIARNPLDAAISKHYQTSALMTAGNPGLQNGDEGLPEPARQWLLDNIAEMGTAHNGYFEKTLKDLYCAWERRAEPNVVLVHYEDLSADLEGEMRRLAQRLDIAVPEDKWPSLVQAATFKRMRAAADQLQPLQNAPSLDVSKGHAAFFRKGSSGDGRALLSDAEAARYRARAAQMAPQELLAWLHRGDWVGT